MTGETAEIDEQAAGAYGKEVGERRRAIRRRRGLSLPEAGGPPGRALRDRGAGACGRPGPIALRSRTGWFVRRGAVAATGQSGCHAVEPAKRTRPAAWRPPANARYDTLIRQ